MATERNRWDKLTRESRHAYGAFRLYRDFGWERSLAKVYRKLKNIPGDQPVPVPGKWNDWSRKHEWTARADAFDAHQDAIEQQERDKHAAKTAARIAQRQSDFEWKRQLALEDQFDRIDAVLKKAEQAPIVDETANIDKTDIAKDGTKTVTVAKIKKKGINYSGYARLTEEKRAHAAEAGMGPRHQAPTKVELSGHEGGPIQIIISPADAKL